MRRLLGIILLAIILIPPMLLFNFQTNASTTYGTTETKSGISISGSYLTKEIWRGLKTITINQTNVNITAGTTLAPHLYDWYFNGVDNYISIVPTNLSVTLFNITIYWFAQSQDQWLGISNPHTIGFYLYYGSSYTGKGGIYIPSYWNCPQCFTFWTRNATDYNWQITRQFDIGWHLHSFIFNGSTLSIYEDGNLLGYTVRPDVITFNILKISGNIFAKLEGTVSYLSITSKENFDLLFDPTFFNGSDYFDLIHGVVGVPYGGVFRVPANRTWVWVVNGLYSDGYVHLRFFPIGSSVMFYNASNHVLVKKVVVTSNDVKVVLPSGRYDVVVHTFINRISIHIIDSLIDCTKVGVYSSNDVTNATFKIVLTSANFTYWDKLNINNIYVTDGENSPVYYWIEKLDTVNKVVVIWVKANLVSGVNYFYIHYGSSNPFTSYIQPKEVFPLWEDWSENVSKSYTGWATVSTALTTEWTLWGYGYDTGSTMTASINTTNLIMSVTTDTLVTNVADYIYSSATFTPTTKLIATMLIPSYGTSSSIVIGFGYPASYNNFDGAYVKFTSSGTQVITDNGTVVYNTYSWHPPVNAWTEVMLELNQTSLKLYYYNTSLSQWVYVGSVTLNFDPSAYTLHAFLGIKAGASQTQYLYSKKYLYAYNVTTSITGEAVVRSGGDLSVLYPNTYQVSYAKIFTDNKMYYVRPEVSAYNSTFNKVVISGVGDISDVDILLTSDFNPILYLNSYNNYTYFPYGYNVSITSAMLDNTFSPITGYPINYTIVETDPHRIIEQEVSVGKVIVVEANITTGTVLAPHLYDWYFNGINSWINLDNNPIFDNSTYYRTLVLFFTPKNVSIGGSSVLYDEGGTVNGIGVTLKNGYLCIGTWSITNNWNYVGSWTKIVPNKLYGAGLVFVQYKYLQTYINGEMVGNYSVPSFIASHPDPDALGALHYGTIINGTSIYINGVSHYFNGYLSAFIMFNSTMSSSDIKKVFNHVINISDYNKVYFVDPTFYNGTNYFNLFGSFDLILNNLNRVPANDTWLWVVDGLYSDGYVHLRFFPNGTIIKVYNTNGELVRKFTITGTPNGAGLIDDFKIILPSGTYKIVAQIPSGNILAPHLYDWYFDGTGHIKLPLLNLFFSPKATIETYIKPNGKTGSIEDVFRAQTMWVNGWTNGFLYPSFRVYLYFNASWHYIDIGNIVGWSSIGLGYINGSNGLFVGYVNGTEINNITGNLVITPPRIYVDIGSENGNYYYKGWIAYIKYYTNFDPSIFQSTILDMSQSKLVLFDPTFFNGSDYFDLVNESVVGVPYGGVYRVPANDTWVWDVITYDYGHDVNLKWFPTGSVLQFIDPTTGEVVKQVVVTSTDDHVSIPAGTYLLKVYVGIKDYGGQLATDSYGQVHIYLVTPPNDSIIFIQVYSSGYYMGLQTLRIVSTNVSYTVDVPDMVKKNVSFNYTVKALLSATGLPVVKITVNGTLFDTYIKTLSFKYNESGHHNFTLLLSGSRDAVNVSYVFKKTLFVGGHVNWIVTLSPNYVPYPLNYSFKAYLDVKYDNGERVTVPISVNVTRLDTMSLVYTNTSKPVINMSLVAVWDLRLTAKMTDLDGESYTFSYTIWSAIPHQSFSIVVKDRGYVFLLNTTIKHVFLEHEPDKYNQTVVFLDFFNFSIDVYRDYVLVLSQNTTNPMYFNVPQGYEVDVYFDMIGKKIVMYVYLPGAVRPGTMTVANANPLVSTAPNIALPVPSNNMFSSYGLVGSILSTAMILGVGIGFARAERDPVTGIAIASAIMIPVSLLIGNQTAYYLSLAILVVSLGYKIMRWLTS